MVVLLGEGMGKDEQGQKGTFWNNANILSYKSFHNCQNSSKEHFGPMMIYVQQTSIEHACVYTLTHIHTRQVTWLLPSQNLQLG